MPGLPELLVVLVIILIVLGPKRLPSLGRQVGGGLREFKDGLTKRGRDDDEAVDASPAPARPELTRAQPSSSSDESPARSGG